MSSSNKRLIQRKRRQSRVRRKVRGTAERPRLCVFRSLKFTYAQFIADDSGVVLGAASTKTLETSGASASSSDGAKALGQKMAEIAKEKKITSVVFDRNGYVYHGRVAAVAEGARDAGLEF